MINKWNGFKMLPSTEFTPILLGVIQFEDFTSGVNTDLKVIYKPQINKQLSFAPFLWIDYVPYKSYFVYLFFYLVTPISLASLNIIGFNVYLWWFMCIGSDIDGIV